MDSRTRLAIGGMTTVAASIAVVCAVSMTTAAALADSAGATVGARPVVVPTSAASPTPVARPTAVPAPSPPAASLPVQPETVPAPEPEDITAPSAAQTPLAEPSAQTQNELAAEVVASASWDVVYAWADKHGWSHAHTEAWIARLDARIADEQADQNPAQRAGEDAERLLAPDSLTGNRMSPPAKAEKASERDRSGPSFGSKRERSQVPPD